MWMTEWSAINAKILGLIEAGTLYLRAIDGDDFASDTTIIKSAKSTIDAIKNFSLTWSKELPDASRICIDEFLMDYQTRFRPNYTIAGWSGVHGLVTTLASFRTEFEYLIHDADAAIRNIVIRAFLHLQRIIVADKVVQERWISAFDSGEPACEALGACHLLHHGIWAFKTSAAGERTDLVFNEPLEIGDNVRRAASGLILTEWKVAHSQADLNAKVHAALTQANRYQLGILAGFELASPRYIVIVSNDLLKMPDASFDGKIRYEYVNVAIRPKVPSKDSRHS